MNDIAKNLKFCFDISKFKSMSQFCKVIGIDQANLSKKMSKSNTKYSFTKNDIRLASLNAISIHTEYQYFTRFNE